MNIKSKIWHESPILFYSVIEDNYEKFVEKLFNYSSVINTPNIYGESLLHYSCFHGMIDKYYALINIGAKIQNTNQNNNLLHYATINGKDDFLIVELVKSGFNPIEKNMFGHTSVHYAENERICHYLNLWCLRNNINIKEIKDNYLNSVADSSKILGNFKSLHYWLTNYPQITQSKNINKLHFNEITHFSINKKQFCPY